jgi:Cu2+-containing amine oxidase
MKLPSIDWHLTAPPGLSAEERTERAFFTYTVPGATRLRDLHTLPLAFRIDASDCDYRNWKAFDFFYANQGPFATTADLMHAYHHNDVKKYSVPSSWVWGPDNYIAHTRENEFPKDPLPFTNLPPPRFYEPAGPRYTIDGHVVNWMGWNFHIASTQRYGPRVTDVTFRGKRVLYEWAMNSVSLVYSCDDPVQGNVFYYDATFGIGETSDPIPTECPETSHFIWDTYWSVGSSGPSYSPRAACIYEAPTGLPKYRQKDGVEVALRETKLVIAFHVPVGNYDYSTVWTFSVLGEMSLEYGATGNMQTIFWRHDQVLSGDALGHGPFGDRVSKYSIGCLHDHTFGYKLDFDIWGHTSNSFEVTKFKSGARKFNPLWNEQQDKYLEYPTIRWYERNYPKTELDDYARMEMSMQTPGAFRIVDTEATNGLGSYPGYEIMYSMGLVHDIATDQDTWGEGTHPILKGGNYRRSHIAITKRKEEEDSLEDPFALNRANDPLFSLDDYFDGDDIYQEDIVAWVTASFIHHPVAEDWPVMSSMFSGVHIRPTNFFDYNPAIDLPHYYKLNGVEIRNEAPAAPCVPQPNTGDPPGDGGSD